MSIYTLPVFNIFMNMIQSLRSLGTILFLSFAAPLLATPQKAILFCFIGFFYFGVSFYSIPPITFDFADIGLVLIAISFFSFFLIPLARHPERGSPAARPIQITLWIFVVWCCISALFNLPGHRSDAISGSLWFLFNFIQLPIAFYIFSSKPLQNYRDIIFNAILLFSFLESLLAFAQYFVFSQTSVTGTFFIHHALLANMMVPAAVIALYRGLQVKKQKIRWLYIALFALFIYTIILSATRSVLVGIGIAFVVFLLHFLKLRWKHLLILCLIVLSGFFVIKLTPLENIINATIRSRDTPLALDMSSFGRLLIWKGSVEYFLKIPLHKKCIGCGPGTFSTVIFDFFIFTTKHSTGAHNNYLHALIETGIIGLLVFISLFVTVLVSLHRRSKKDPLAFALFYGTIALLGSGISQETFWAQPVFGNFWLFTIVITALVFGRPEEKNVFRDRLTNE